MVVVGTGGGTRGDAEGDEWAVGGGHHKECASIACRPTGCIGGDVARARTDGADVNRGVVRVRIVELHVVSVKNQPEELHGVGRVHGLAAENLGEDRSLEADAGDDAAVPHADGAEGVGLEEDRDTACAL